MNDLYLIGNGCFNLIGKLAMRFSFKAVRLVVIGFVIFLFWSSTAFGHSGRTDSNGGHFNRKTGEYHTHKNGASSDGNGAIVLGIVFFVIVIGAIVKGAIGDDK